MDKVAEYVQEATSDIHNVPGSSLLSSSGGKFLKIKEEVEDIPDLIYDPAGSHEYIKLDPEAAGHTYPDSAVDSGENIVKLECSNAIPHMCDTVDIKEFSEIKKEAEATLSGDNCPNIRVKEESGKGQPDIYRGDNCLNFLIKEEEEVHLPNVYGVAEYVQEATSDIHNVPGSSLLSSSGGKFLKIKEEVEDIPDLIYDPAGSHEYIKLDPEAAGHTYPDSAVDSGENIVKLECSNAIPHMCDTVDIKEFSEIKKEAEATLSGDNCPNIRVKEESGKGQPDIYRGDNCLNFLIKEEEEVHLPNVYGASLKYCNMYFTNEEDEKPFLGFEEGNDLVKETWLRPDERSCDLRFICHHCEFYTSTKSSLRYHILAGHINNKVCECPNCGYRNYNKSKQKMHIKRKHTSERRYECDLCKKKFSRLWSLTCHKKVHSGEKPFVCEVCKKRFSTKGNVKTHMRLHTGDKPFICEICKKRFSRKSTLKAHMRMHTGDKPFICEVCNKRFATKGNVKTHMRLHTGDKPFICEICKKRFSYKSSLPIHMRLHTGDKPFICVVCKKGFNQESSLKTHMRLHTGDKSFICEVCNKRFVSYGILKRHMSVHTGDKPYICEICEKRFSQKSTLLIHMRLHTGDKPFICEVCKKRFSYKCILKKHMRVHTGY